MVLSELQPGQKGRVVQFNQITRAVRKKLYSLGILPDSELELVRVAPMGDPIQIRSRGINLAIQKSLAAEIRVEAL